MTQFELLTAAAYSELASRGVEVAVIEAGLGGRYDATNVIPSRVQVLTSVGLEHTRWLGPTITAIASEKLDVVQPGGTLVLGYGLHPDAVAVAEAVAAERGARSSTPAPIPACAVGALGAFQRRNFALARAAAEAYLGELDPAAVAAAAAEVRVPGRLQVIDEEPLTLVDGAHNPDGIAALAESLPEIVGRRPRPRRRGRLDPRRQGRRRDAAPALLPMCDAIVLTASQNPRALPPPTLAVARRPARRAAVRGRARPHAALGAGPRARRPGRAWWSPPARSIWSPTCCRPAGRGAAPRCCERRSSDGRQRKDTELPDDDRRSSR